MYGVWSARLVNSLRCPPYGRAPNVQTNLVSENENPAVRGVVGQARNSLRCPPYGRAPNLQTNLGSENSTRPYGVWSVSLVTSLRAPRTVRLKTPTQPRIRKQYPAVRGVFLSARIVTSLNDPRTVRLKTPTQPRIRKRVPGRTGCVVGQARYSLKAPPYSQAQNSNPTSYPKSVPVPFCDVTAEGASDGGGGYAADSLYSTNPASV